MGSVVTITDVAARARVAVSTVSRVLNDSPRVSAATRARVRESIDRLDFRPNPLARGLVRGRCHTVGVVIPFFTHASAVERLRGVVDALRGSRHDVVLFNVETPRQRDEHFAALRRRDRADGLLVLSLPPPDGELARLAEAGMPCVLVDTVSPGVPIVVTDDVEGGRMATRHLLELGHERIGFVGDDPANDLGFRSSTQREVGYVETLRAAGIEPRPQYVRYGTHDRAVARHLAEEMLALADPPTAIFASSDVQATGVLAAARAVGLQVPGDLSVVGFDDIEISTYAGITTVRQPLYESGRLGAELLLEALAGEELPDPVVRELPLELVERSTTTPPRKG